MSRKEEKSTDQEQAKQSSQPEKQEAVVNHTRRKFMIGGAAAITLAAVGYGILKDEKQAPEQNKKKISIELIEDKSIQIPSCEILADQQIDFKKPSSLEIGEGEFLDYSKHFVDKIRKLAEEFTKNTVADNSVKYFQSLNQFIEQAQNIVIYSDPRITADFREFSKSLKQVDPKDKFPLIIERINQYISPGGLYLYFNNDTPNRIPMINIYAISKTGHVKIADSKGEEIIPHVYLNDPLLPRHRFSLGGTADGTKEKVLIFENDMEGVKEDFMNFGVLSRDELNDKEVDKNSLRHESIHLFIMRRFPKTSANIMKSVPHKIPFNFGEGNLFLKKQVPVYEAHEVCGIGAQLMHSNTKNELTAYLRAPHQKQYALAMTLVVMATMQVITDYPEIDCPEIREIIKKLKNTKQVDVIGLQKIVKSKKFTIEHTRRVGEILYRIGYNFFVDAEKQL